MPHFQMAFSNVFASFHNYFKTFLKILLIIFISVALFLKFLELCLRIWCEKIDMKMETIKM